MLDYVVYRYDSYRISGDASEILMISTTELGPKYKELLLNRFFIFNLEYDDMIKICRKFNKYKEKKYG